MDIIDRKAHEILRELGVPVHLDGFYYLRRAVKLYAQITEKRERSVRMMIDIYAKVADEYKTNPRCVEHSIRTAIDKAFREGDFVVLERFFGNAINPSTGKVTSQTFIAYVAEIVLQGSDSDEAAKAEAFKEEII